MIDPSATMSASTIMSFMPIILMIGVFYLLIWRPQAQRAAEHKKMLSELRRGDKVLTNGGLYAKISKIIDDEKVMLTLADETEIEFHRPSIATVVEKTEPAKSKKLKAAKK